MNKKIDEYVIKISQTDKAIQTLIYEDKEYDRKIDTTQLYMTASSTFADIFADFSNIVKGEKGTEGITEGIENYKKELISLGINKEDAELASNILYGVKSPNRNIIENVFIPHVKESFDYIIQETGMNGEGIIDDSIEFNDQDFELSEKLQNKINEKFLDESFIKKNNVPEMESISTEKVQDSNVEMNQNKKEKVETAKKGFLYNLFHRKGKELTQEKKPELKKEEKVTKENSEISKDNNPTRIRITVNLDDCELIRPSEPEERKVYEKQKSLDQTYVKHEINK